MSLSSLTESDRLYLRPILAGPGRLDFSAIELLVRGPDGSLTDAVHAVGELDRLAQTIPAGAKSRLELLLQQCHAPRTAPAGLSFGRPLIMGVVNVTPDSFSDGGDYLKADAAVSGALSLATDGADILDIGGESTRPGAEEVSVDEELGRVLPVIEQIGGCGRPISIDTRKADVMSGALEAGASIINDVSALEFDPKAMAVAAETDAPVILMHARGNPETMQKDPRYKDVLLDVFDYLEGRILACEAAGISRSRLIVDPGIGFGKTVEHNLALLRGLSLFRALGCPVLLGASRKSFIGRLSGTPAAKDRLGGSLAAALWAVREGADIVRVHDVAATRQALTVWTAIGGDVAVE